MAEVVDFEYRSRQLRRATLFLLLGVVVVIFALALPTSSDRLPSAELGNPVDEVWVLFCASLVFFMQAGFLMFEVGFAREAHATAVAVKNIMDWTVGSLAFFSVGFGVMFGRGEGYYGSEFFALEGLFDIEGASISGPTFFLFQLAFAGTAITIISGSLVERTTFLAYVLFSAVVGLVIYPVYGHWVWSGVLNSDNQGWLAELGFRDFAGGTVVHTTGAWAALVGVIMVGPRIGRFRANGSIRVFESSSIPMTALGTLILWFGWFGFNGGSSLALTGDVPRIILVTNLSGVAGLFGAAIYSYLVEDRVDMIGKMIGGALSGLVAITAGANVVGPLGAIVVGFVAGVLYDIGYEMLLRLKIDDALGVVPAHGIAGMWGTIALAIFAPSSALGRSNLEQLAVQVFGVVANMVWVVVTSFIVFGILKRTIGLRVSPIREQRGVQLEADDHVRSLETGDGITDDELSRLLD